MTQDNVTFMGAALVAAFIGGGLTSVAFSARVGAQGSPRVVTAEQVNVVSRAGRIRAVLSAEDERGMTSLTLFDESGERRSALTIALDGTPALQLYDRAQAARVMVTLENDQPAIVINGTAGDRAMLSTLTGGPALTFQDRERVRADVGMGRGGAPRLGMVGPTGQSQINLGVSDQGEPVVTLRDTTGRGRATVGIVSGATVINLADQQAARVVLGVAADGTATLSFLDQTGRLTARVP